MDIQEAESYLNGFFSEELTVDPKIVHNYQTILHNAVCPTCNNKIYWNFGIESDKFCHTVCCGIKYSMVPETIRILSVPLAVNMAIDKNKPLSSQDLINMFAHLDENKD